MARIPCLALHNHPKNFRIGIIENLPQHRRADQDVAEPWDGHRLFANLDAFDPLDDETEFLRSRVLGQRVCAFGRQQPESRAKKLAASVLEMIRLRYASDSMAARPSSSGMIKRCLRSV